MTKMSHLLEFGYKDIKPSPRDALYLEQLSTQCPCTEGSFLLPHPRLKAGWLAALLVCWLMVL